MDNLHEKINSDLLSAKFKSFMKSSITLVKPLFIFKGCKYYYCFIIILKCKVKYLTVCFYLHSMCSNWSRRST